MPRIRNLRLTLILAFWHTAPPSDGLIAWYNTLAMTLERQVERSSLWPKCLWFLHWLQHS